MRIQDPIHNPYSFDEEDAGEAEAHWEDGVPKYINLNLGITNITAENQDTNGERLTLCCQGVYKDDLVGFDLDIKRWHPWGLRDRTNYPRAYFDDLPHGVHINPEGYIEHGVKIVAREQETARLVRYMADHFGTRPEPILGTRQPNSVSLSSIAFSPEKHDVLSEFSAIKLAYDEFNESDGPSKAYWQAFLRIDPKIGAIRLEEKDIDYRQAQINVLFDALVFPKKAN